MYLSADAVGVSANSLSSDMHGQDLTVIMLHCPAVLLFNLSGFCRYNIYQTSPGMMSSHLSPKKLLFCWHCLFVYWCVTPLMDHLLYCTSILLSLPQVPSHAAGTEQIHPRDSHTHPQPSVTHIQAPCVCLHRGVGL